MAKRSTTPEWITPQEFQALAEKSATPATVRHLALRKEYISEIDRKMIDDEQRTITFRISTGARDRDRDTIDPRGWRLDNFRRSPTVLWAHDYSGLPIGKAVSLEARPDALISTAQFATRELYPFADTVYQMVKAGFISATSVGFKPLAWSYNEEERGIDYSEQELLEWSICAVPSNPQALIEARSAGMDLTPMFAWAEEKLAGWKKEDGLYVPKSQVEAVFQILSVHKTTSAPESPAPVTEAKVSTADVPEAIEAKPFPHEHACRLRNPNDFQDGSFRRVEREHEGRGYSVIMGKLTGEDTMTEQAYRYPSGTWPVSEARAHCRSHDGIAFEPATGEASVMPEKTADTFSPIIHGVMDETEERTAKGFNPGAFPLETSWEWVRERLARTAKEYLTRMGARVREDDWAVVAATFPARAVVGVIGPDRPYADDVCYEVGWTETADGPAWSGEPQEIDVAVHAEIVPVLREMKAELIAQKIGRVLSAANEGRCRNAAQKAQECHDEIMAVLAQLGEAPQEEALEITDAKSADPVLDIAEPAEEELTIAVPENGSGNGNITHADISRAMAEAAQSILSNMDSTVERAVTATINRLRGRID